MSPSLLDAGGGSSSTTLPQIAALLGPFAPKPGEIGVVNQAWPSGDPRRHGAIGDGVANDTAGVQACATSCIATGHPLFVDAFCTYAITQVSVNGAVGALKELVILGAGRGISQIVRHASALTDQTDLVHTMWVNLELRDVAFDQKWNGSAGSVKGCVFAYKAQRVNSTRSAYTNGQYHGLNIAACDHVSVENCDFDHCYYSGCSVGGGLISGADVPYGANVVSITNNRFNYCYGGAVVQVYVYDLTISGNIGRNSSIQVGQPCFRISVTDNTIYGSNTTFGAALIEPASDGLFFEAPTDCTVSNNVIVSPAGNGIYVSGSEIHTVPSGPNEGPLPVQRTAIHGNEVYGAGATSLLVSGRATNVGFPGSPTPDGSDVGIHHNMLIGGATGLVLNGCKGGIVGFNYQSGAQAHGCEVGGASYMHFVGNTFKNNSQVAPGIYHGVVLSQASFANVFQSNFIRDDQAAPTQTFGIYDQVLDGGVASMTRYKANTFIGNRAASIYPAPAAPTLGTWPKDEFIEDIIATEFGVAGAKFTRTGWRSTVAGTPGTWVEVRALTGN